MDGHELNRLARQQVADLFQGNRADQLRGKRICGPEITPLPCMILRIAFRGRLRSVQLMGNPDPVQREQVHARMKSLAGEIKRNPQLESILNGRASELGIERGSSPDRVLKEPKLERALELSVQDLGRDHGLEL